MSVLLLPHTLQEFDAGLVGLETFLFKLHDIVRSRLDLLLKLGFRSEHLFILSLELYNFLHKNINVRLLLNSHLFKLVDVDNLFATHPFKHSNVLCLLKTHFF